MSNFTTGTCTIALVGHSGGGKTTLAESLLFKTGAIGAMGGTEKGTTVWRFRSAGKSNTALAHSSLIHFSHGGAGST